MQATPKLSVQKRKREDTNAPETPANTASGTATAATPSLNMQTPRLRTRAGSMVNPTSTPLLAMPSPAPELLPVLNARAAARLGSTSTTEGTPISHALLRASSAVLPGTNAIPSTSLITSAASNAATATAFSNQIRALETAAQERERGLRLSVEELRATVRAKTTDMTEAQLKQEQKEQAWSQEKLALEQKVEKLQTQLRFIHEAERKEAEKVKTKETELKSAQLTQRQQREELSKLKQQLVFASSPLRHQPLSSSTDDDDATSGELKHLEGLVQHQQRTIRELESQNATLTQRLDEADEERLAASETQARLLHTQSQLEEAQSNLRANAAAQEVAEVTSKRAGEFLATQTRVQALAAENTRLKEQKYNAALAEEQLLGLQTKVARLEAEREVTARITLENEQLKARLQEWEESMIQLGLRDSADVGEEQESKMGDIDTVSSSSSFSDSPASKRRRRTITPRPFLESYHELQSTNLQLHSKCNQLESQSKSWMKEKQSLDERLQSLSTKLTQQDQQLTEVKSTLLQTERKCTLLTKERDGLQRVLDQYDNEQTLRPPTTSDGAPANAPMEIDSDAPEPTPAAKLRIQHLESIIKELETQLQSTYKEHGLKAPVNPHQPTEPIPSVLALLSQIVNLEKQHDHLETITNDLSEKVEWVNKQYPHLLDKERGEFKILTLANNPTYNRLQSKYQTQIEALEKENQILNLKLKELQQSGGSGASATDSTTADTPSASALLELQTTYQTRISTLEQEKSTLEKKFQRLKELFGQKVHDFRNTCYLLTGYKIELVPATNSYRLTNMYAEKQNDYLMFQQGPPITQPDGSTKPGPLSVLETDFTKSLDDSTTTYLNSLQSIPGFLATITLDLLGKQTRVR